jgi:hypothetical protein
VIAKRRQETNMKTALALTVLLALAACGEISQDAAKPYAGKEDTKPYAGDLFKGDKAKYEQALADRAQWQNDHRGTQVAASK